MDKQYLQKEYKVVKVYSGNIWEVEIVKRILVHSNIDSFFRHRRMKREDFDPNKFEDIQVMVVEDDFQEAQLILSDLLIGVEEYS